MKVDDFAQHPERSLSSARPRVPLLRRLNLSLPFVDFAQHPERSLSSARPRVPLLRRPSLSLPFIIVSLATAFVLFIAVALFYPSATQAQDLSFGNSSVANQFYDKDT